MATTYEYRFYEITKRAVEAYYTNIGWSADFDITGHPPLKAVPEKYLRNRVLATYKNQLPTPDIMGWVSRRQDRRLVVVEFKKKPLFWDVFQAKGYDELFDADCTLLVSEYPLYESSKKVFQFLSEKPELTRTKNGTSHVVFKFLQQTQEGHVVLAQLGTDVGKLPDAADWEL